MLEGVLCDWLGGWVGARGTWSVLGGVSCDWVGAGRIFFVLIVWVGGCSRDLVCVGGSFV